MSESKKVYVVTSGDYDDYAIIAFFSTKEKAEKYCEAKNKCIKSGEHVDVEHDYDIEVYDLDDPNCDNGLLPFRIVMEYSGYIHHGDYWDFNEDRCKNGEVSEYYPFRPNPKTFYVMAKDLKHAVKIANEKRIMMIADGAWKYTEENNKEK